MYSVLTWKTPPGTASIQQPKARIDALTEELHLEHLLAWIRKLNAQGPSAANRYIDEMHRVRSDARGFVDDAFRDAQAISRAIAGETASAIAALASIRLGASVGGWGAFEDYGDATRSR